MNLATARAGPRSRSGWTLKFELRARTLTLCPNWLFRELSLWARSGLRSVTAFKQTNHGSQIAVK